ALWALVAVYLRQSSHALAGSDTSAWVALLIAILLVAQTAILRLRNPGGWVPAEGRRPMLRRCAVGSRGGRSRHCGARPGPHLHLQSRRLTLRRRRLRFVRRESRMDVVR